MGDFGSLWEPTPWAISGVCGSPPRGRFRGFVGAHPVGDFGSLWEPTPWAMGVENALNFAPETIAHGAGSCTKPRLGPSPKAQGFGRALIH